MPVSLKEKTALAFFSRNDVILYSLISKYVWIELCISDYSPLGAASDMQYSPSYGLRKFSTLTRVDP